MSKSRRAASSDTSVSLRTPSTSLRPTWAYNGVISDSQRLDSRGESTGTSIIVRRSPRCRAYSRISSP